MSSADSASQSQYPHFGSKPARASAPVSVDAKRRAAKREALFRERPLDVFSRVALGTAWAITPKRLDRLVSLIRVWLADQFMRRQGLPEADVPAANGDFAGIVRDLSVPTLVEAYSRGLTPRTHFGPLKWVSPVERCVLSFEDFHISRRIRSIMRQNRCTVTFDQDFERVITACAGRRKGHWHVTWITPRIMRAYADLYDAGYVHSFEVWNRDGSLVGGGYGVALGGVFFVESQFCHESNMSKIGFSVLNWHLTKWGFLLCDNQIPTPTVTQMGFRVIPRRAFLRDLDRGLACEGKKGRWEVEAGPKLVADWNQ